MNIPRRRFLQFASASLAMPAVLRSAHAQSWPAQTIRAHIPFSAGSSVDVIGRIVMDPLSRALGQPIVVENRGGAGGTIGSARVASSPPDGYNILINASAHSAAPAAYPNIAYDVVKDFAAVIPFGSIPNVVVVSPASGIKSIRDLIAKGRSGELTYSSAGVGSATHWAAERLRLAAGFKGTHVPFRGGPEATMEVVAGRVDFACMGMSSVLGLVQDGKVTAIGVCTPQRSAALPDIPTTLEAGLPDSDYIFWNGLFVLAKTPQAIIDRLYQETKRVLALPAVQERFKPQGIEPMDLTPAQYDALIKKEVATNLAFVKAAGLKFQ